jgi:hypothetical protein
MIKPETASHDDVVQALTSLLNCLSGTKTGFHKEKDVGPDVFIAFDEVYTLAQPIDPNHDPDRTLFIEIRSALQALTNTSAFVFFLSTTTKISQFAMPGDISKSHQLESNKLRTPLPFSDLGFDLLMRDRRITKSKTIDEVASVKCVVYMGRPL